MSGCDLVVRINCAALVQHAPEKDVAHGKAKTPITLQLLLHAPCHDFHPQIERNPRRILFSSMPWRRRPFWHVGHSGAKLEEKCEGHPEIPRHKLFLHLAAAGKDEAIHVSTACAVQVPQSFPGGICVSCGPSSWRAPVTCRPRSLKTRAQGPWVQEARRNLHDLVRCERTQKSGIICRLLLDWKLTVPVIAAMSQPLVDQRADRSTASQLDVAFFHAGSFHHHCIRPLFTKTRADCKRSLHTVHWRSGLLGSHLLVCIVV